MSLEVDRKEQILIEKLKVDKANGFSKLMWELHKETLKECMQMYADEMLQSEQLIPFCRWYNQTIPNYESTEKEIIETYFRERNSAGFQGDAPTDGLSGFRG